MKQFKTVNVVSAHQSMSFKYQQYLLLRCYLENLKRLYVGKFKD